MPAARNPPPEFPVRTYPAPVISEQVVIEWVTSELANSKPLVPGTPHPNLRDYAGFKLGIQRVAPNDPYFTQRIWVNDQVANQEVYNYALKYVSESNAHPIFIRSDRELKTSYVARTKGTALQSVYKLTVSNKGSGYTYGTEPALTFSSGAAAGHAIVAPDGTIAEFIIESGGIGYTSAPTFTVAGPPSGTTATGLAFIQPTSAILVSEEAQLFPQDSEFFALYFNVVRAYQTLPGPVLNDVEYDQEWDVGIPSTRQNVANSSINLSTNRQNVKASDSVQSEVVTFDPAALAAVFGSYLNYFPGTRNERLPDVLLGLTAIESSANGAGGYVEEAVGAGSGTTWFMSMSERGEGQGSASTMLGLRVEYKQYWGQNIPTITYYFFLPSPITASQIITKLQTLTGLTIGAWPQFKPEGHTVTLVGQKINTSARVKAGFQQSSTSDGSSASDTGGSGGSIDVSTSKDDRVIPPMIHGEINIAGTLSTVVAASATAEALDIINVITVSKSANALAGLSPTSFVATIPAAVPTTGIKLRDSRPVFRRFGYVMIEAETIDCGALA